VCDVGSNDFIDVNLRNAVAQGFLMYLVTAWRRTLANLQPEEHSEVRWLRVEDSSRLGLADPRYPQLFRHALQRFRFGDEV